MTEKVKVQGFTLREIKFSQRGRSDQRSADAVAALQVEKVKETYRRAYGAASDDEAAHQVEKLELMVHVKVARGFVEQ